MKARALVLCCALLLRADGVQGQSIGGYASMDATQCVLTVPAATPGTFYVLAELAGAATNGISGAEFQLTGLPSNWAAAVTPNPAAHFTLGSPLDGEGAQIAFPACRPQGPVLLYTIVVQHTGDTGTYDLVVTRREHPSNPNFECAFVTLCDAPVFTKVCVSTRPLYLNTGQPATFSTPRLSSPQDQATGVPLDAHLSWLPAERRDCFNHPFASHCVFLGTNPDPGETACDPTPYWSAFDPGLLQPLTTYYWRVEADASVSSPVWSFTTGNAVAVQGKSWSAMKRLYSDPAPASARR